LVDTTTVIVLATLVQTIVITLTLLTFIFQFRSQELAIKESSYQNVMGRYNDFIMGAVGKPELVKFIVQRTPGSEPAKEMSAEDASVFGHLLVAYGIIEEAFLLYQKGWIDKDNWEQWAAWLKSMCKRPEFRQIREITVGTFDPRFEAYVLKLFPE
jgi:hypothetical protein